MLELIVSLEEIVEGLIKTPQGFLAIIGIIGWQSRLQSMMLHSDALYRMWLIMTLGLEIALLDTSRHYNI